MVPFYLPLFRYVWLPAASFFAGVLNTIAGGGSFLSLPALIASTSVVGVGAVTAQATNTVALWPGQLTSLVAFRGQLRTYGWSLVPLALASGVGGWLGGYLLLKTGNQIFRADASLAAAVCGRHLCAEFSPGPLALDALRRAPLRQVAAGGYVAGEHLRGLLRGRWRLPGDGVCSASAEYTTSTR